MLRQKLYGIGMLILAVLLAVLLEGDLTFPLVLGAFGLYLVFTREYWMND